MKQDEEQTEYAVRPNKSQQKRELAERANLIEGAAGLSDTELERLGLDADSIAEIDKLRALKPSGARKRQLKFCVKRLANADLQPLAEYLRDRSSQQVAANRQFHHLERWRDRLIEEGDDLLGEAMQEWPDLDRQRLRQLIREARRERDADKAPAAARRLFRYLRELSGL